MYIARKPNYLYGAAIRVDVGYDREIRREGHCYSEREQRGGGALKRREQGYCHLNTRSRKMSKVPTKQIQKSNQHVKRRLKF